MYVSDASSTRQSQKFLNLFSGDIPQYDTRSDERVFMQFRNQTIVMPLLPITKLYLLFLPEIEFHKECFIYS